ncbi:hypothetical protein HK098_002701, partial [Nowakowskiella sp. JEL0407]
MEFSTFQNFEFAQWQTLLHVLYLLDIAITLSQLLHVVIYTPELPVSILIIYFLLCFGRIALQIYWTNVDIDFETNRISKYSTIGLISLLSIPPIFYFAIFTSNIYLLVSSVISLFIFVASVYVIIFVVNDDLNDPERQRLISGDESDFRTFDSQVFESVITFENDGGEQNEVDGGILDEIERVEETNQAQGEDGTRSIEIFVDARFVKEELKIKYLVDSLCVRDIGYDDFELLDERYSGETLEEKFLNCLFKLIRFLMLRKNEDLRNAFDVVRELLNLIKERKANSEPEELEITCYHGIALLIRGILCFFVSREIKGALYIRNSWKIISTFAAKLNVPVRALSPHRIASVASPRKKTDGYLDELAMIAVSTFLGIEFLSHFPESYGMTLRSLGIKKSKSFVSSLLQKVLYSESIL